MSRTDVHRPWSVQVKDPYNRHRLRRFQVHPYRHDWYPLYNVCGCAWCTDAEWNRARRRGERHEWQRVQNELLKSRDWDGGWLPKYRSSGW